jgi:hypothetical protein
MLRTVPLLALLSLSAFSANLPVREASTPAIVSQRLPGFYNGYLYSVEPKHVLTLFAPDGHELFSLPFPGRGNGKVSVESVAIDADGTLAVAWQDPPNAGIDIRDLSGTPLRTIDTGGFFAAHLSFGQDHALWALGWQAGSQDYAMLRKYSGDGQQAAAFLPRSLFPAGLNPGMQEWQKRRLTVTADRVGIEAVSGNIGNRREWVELDLNGNLKGRWKMDDWDESPGVAFTSDDQAYVHRYNRDTKLIQTFRLDRAAGQWKLVDAPNAELYGADGVNLVFADWTGVSMHLSWFPQP